MTMERALEAVTAAATELRVSERATAAADRRDREAWARWSRGERP